MSNTISIPDDVRVGVRTPNDFEASEFTSGFGGVRGT